MIFIIYFYVNKTSALKNFKINNHQDVPKAFNIFHSSIHSMIIDRSICNWTL